MEWQPIETAPTDETIVLIYSPKEGVRSSHFAGGIWQNGAWFSDSASREAAKPVAWMPLPKPPAM